MCLVFRRSIVDYERNAFFRRRPNNRILIAVNARPQPGSGTVATRVIVKFESSEKESSTSPKIGFKSNSNCDPSTNSKTQLESCGKNPFEIREYDIRVDLARSLSSNEGRNVRDSYRASEAKGS